MEALLAEELLNWLPLTNGTGDAHDAIKHQRLGSLDWDLDLCLLFSGAHF